MGTTDSASAINSALSDAASQKHMCTCPPWRVLPQRPDYRCPGPNGRGRMPNRPQIKRHHTWRPSNAAACRCPLWLRPRTELYAYQQRPGSPIKCSFMASTCSGKLHQHNRNQRTQLHGVALHTRDLVGRLFGKPFCGRCKLSLRLYSHEHMEEGCVIDILEFAANVYASRRSFK